MPYKPNRQCTGHGPCLNKCPNLIKNKEPYCPACMGYLREELKLYDNKRDQTRERRFIHSMQWRKIRDVKLNRDPLCEECLELGREIPAILVHHIDGDEFNNDPEGKNHRSLCNNCHEAIHKKERWKKI